jgi:hypothetical protein
MSDTWIFIYVMLLNYLLFALSCFIMYYDKKREELWIKVTAFILITMVVTSILGIITL